MKATISPDRTRLTITVDADERAELRALTDEQLYTNEADFLEPITANSELDWIPEGWTGDLTNAPMLGIVEWSKPTERGYEVSERWAFMDYQVTSLLEQLRDHGEAVLVGGS